jgi:hypothetical protein
VLRRKRLGRRPVGRKVLLASGILSSLLYVAANVLGALRWKGYSSRSQTVSELSAIEAPSRLLVIPLFTAYSVLGVAFGLGVYECARRKRPLRVTGGLRMGLGAIDLAAPFYPMHQREALARGEKSRTDTMHITVTSADSLLIVLAIGFGSTAFGERFRRYSIGTILVLVAAGGLTATQASRLEADLPTPWAGVSERVCIGGYLLWQAVLAAALLRAEAEAR